jgi:hypothetical protein
MGHNRPPAPQQAALLFDDLVGEAEQRDRDAHKGQQQLSALVLASLAVGNDDLLA